MEEPDVIVAPGKKSLLQSKTLWFLVAAGIAQIAQQVVLTMPNLAWLADTLGQLNLMLLGMAGVTRATATGPLR